MTRKQEESTEDIVKITCEVTVAKIKEEYLKQRAKGYSKKTAITML